MDAFDDTYQYMKVKDNSNYLTGAQSKRSLGLDSDVVILKEKSSPDQNFKYTFAEELGKTSPAKIFKRDERDNEIDQSSPRFKARGNTSMNMSVSNPFAEGAMENNFIITPERMRNIESPDNAFKKAQIISKAKANRR